MMLRDPRSSSCPPSPGRSMDDGRSRRVNEYVLENEHLREQISLLQFELDNRRRAAAALQEAYAASEARAMASYFIPTNF